ncbi:DUF1793-domain-containing protein [Aspergillus ibericus CBS 121593]|uniref:DUF1793-domain-containing protein n=1 Tax=Aspergillus ibericus CBS 121593 TaxID=1448316 RepID=A0A395GXK7_9EURO|nr:DUF1793-domain-containing protein [Aspergillus ibericus CBS 121593]RAK98793.1 DUF1793-domain-containing protein [Aspergillus ibericus CBS 121593]
MYLNFSTNSLIIGLLATLVLAAPPREHDFVTHRPALPPSYPLAVRSPYLSAWMPSDQVRTLPYAEPQFWAGQSLTWSVMARVNGQAYSLMGIKDPDENIRPAIVESAEYTATHSIFTLSAGSTIFTLDFFSPISPSSYLRQSLPFSYLTVSVSYAAFKRIEIYSSIDGTWTGRPQNTTRDFIITGCTHVFSLGVDDAIPFSEDNDMATWGEAVFASRSDSFRVSFASGKSEDVRSQFVRTGKLADKNPPWVPGGVVALAHELGPVDRLQSVTFAVGHVREESINYLGKPYTGYYRYQHPKPHHAVSHFLKDYPAAHRESWALDMEMKIQANKAGGKRYADIVTLSARQAYGGIEVTIPNDTLDTTDVLAFIKELSSDGNLNTVDVIMPAFPLYYTLNPDYIRLLLEPMMRYLATGRWQKPYVIHDMGTHYPNATGHDNQQAEPMPIEECGNLLVLVLAYVRATGDTQWAAQYTDLLQGYADYLVDNGVDITEQLSSNDAAGALANETNLAIKAAVGIKAFGELTGRAEYSRIGQARADLFFTQGRGTDEEKTHFVLQYPDKPASWKIPYNLYPDVLLDLQTFPKGAYEMGSTFFKSVRAEYGVPLDNRQDWAKSDWNMWLAGTMDSSTRAEFVDDLWTFMTNGKHNWPFSDRYVATSSKGNSPGVPVLCRARPTVGGHFALMALQGPKSLQKAPRPPHNFGPQGYPLPNGAVPSGPVPGAAPLLPNNGRIIQNGPVRVLCIADVRGNLKSLNELARQARADHIIHTGDFGFYDDTSLERIADKTLKHVAQYSPLLPENVKRTIAQTPPQQSIKQRFTPDQLPLSELPMLLDKRLTLDVPVYTVWGACEDVRVLEKFRSGEYKVDKLHIIDEANSRLLDIGGVKLRLLGLGGAVVMHKLFDNGEGKTTIAGGQGTMWTTLLQMGELIDTSNRVYDPSETRIFVTHASPAREGMLNQLSVTLKADFSISAGLHFRYGSSYNEFSVNPSLDHYRGKLAASKASFNDVWETVRGEVEAAISQNEAQKTLLDNALEVVNRMPTVANGGNPFGGPAAPGNAAGQVDESAFKNMWNFNLADAAFGFLVLEIEAGRIATEMRAQGFNFAHRTGKPQPAAPAQPAPVPTAPPVNIPSPRVPGAAPQFGQAQPVAPRTALPQQQQPSAQQPAQAKAPAAAPARTSPVPVIPKPATPQPANAPAAQPAAASPERTTATEPNGTAQHEKVSESPLPKVEKKQSNALFLSNVENEQAARDLFHEEDKAKIVRIEKWGKYNNHVVHFSTVDEAKAALDRQPAEHKKPSPAGQPRKPNVKFFEDRGGHRGNAGTWQGSNRGGNTSQRGYQSGGASDSETNRGRGFRGRGGGRGDRGSRGGRGGRGGFNKGAPTSDSGPGDKPAATGGDA